MIEKADSLSSQVSPNPLVEDASDQFQPEGIELEELPIGAVLGLQTGNSFYRLENLGHCKALISGHPVYCPEPIPVQIHGSIWGGGRFKWAFIGKGTSLEFSHPACGVVRTSRIKEISRLTQNPN